MKRAPAPSPAAFGATAGGLAGTRDSAWAAELSASRSAIERQLEGLDRLPAPAEACMPIRSALDLGRQVLRSISA